jgi:hypothetical protein
MRGKHTPPNAAKEQHMPLVIDSRKYSIYVKVLAGEGDGTLIYVDARGHIHIVGPGDPPLKDRLATGIKQIEAGVAAIHEAIGQAPQKA